MVRPQQGAVHDVGKGDGAVGHDQVNPAAAAGFHQVAKAGEVGETTHGQVLQIVQDDVQPLQLGVNPVGFPVVEGFDVDVPGGVAGSCHGVAGTGPAGKSVLRSEQSSGMDVGFAEEAGDNVFAPGPDTGGVADDPQPAVSNPVEVLGQKRIGAGLKWGCAVHGGSIRALAGLGQP